MKKLRCKSRYENKQLAYNVGDVFEADEKLHGFLMSDSPDSFEVLEEEPIQPAEQDIEVPEGTKVVRQRRKK